MLTGHKVTLSERAGGVFHGNCSCAHLFVLRSTKARALQDVVEHLVDVGVVGAQLPPNVTGAQLIMAHSYRLRRRQAPGRLTPLRPGPWRRR